MKRYRTLILMKDTNNFDTFFMEKMRREYIDVLPIFRYYTQLILYIMEIHMRIHLPFQTIWYHMWKKELSVYSTVIVFEALPTESIISYIHKKNPKCRIIYWYWNAVKRPPQNRSFCEYWSFDKEDCLKYNLLYNNQFYFKDIVLETERFRYDGSFIGADKGRLDALRKLENKLNSMKLSTKFIIIKDKRKKYTREEGCCKKMLDYIDVLDIVNHSRFIVDMTRENQSGLTLRFMESIFLKKKIITNNRAVVHTELYHPENVFILKDDNWEEINDFLKIPFKPLEKSVLEKYSYDMWICNLGVEG